MKDKYLERTIGLIGEENYLLIKDKWIADGKPLTDSEDRFMRAATEYIWNPNEYPENQWQYQTSAHLYMSPSPSRRSRA